MNILSGSENVTQSDRYNMTIVNRIPFIVAIKLLVNERLKHGINCLWTEGQSIGYGK